MEVEAGLKWKYDGSESWIEVEAQWKWKYDGSGSAMEVFCSSYKISYYLNWYLSLSFSAVFCGPMLSIYN